MAPPGYLGYHGKKGPIKSTRFAKSCYSRWGFAIYIAFAIGVRIRTPWSLVRFRGKSDLIALAIGIFRLRGRSSFRCHGRFRGGIRGVYLSRLVYFDVGATRVPDAVRDKFGKVTDTFGANQ